MWRHGTSYLKFVIYVLQQEGIWPKTTERTINVGGPWPNSHLWRLQLCLSFCMDLPTGVLTKLWSRHVEQVLWQLCEKSSERSALPACQPVLATFLQPRRIPTRDDDITQSSAADDEHMVARNMLSNYHGRTTYQPDLTTFLQPRHIPTQGYNITQSSASDDGHMVARNMLSNYYGRTTYQTDLTTFPQPRHIPTQGYNITKSSVPDNVYMVARNMLSN